MLPSQNIQWAEFAPDASDYSPQFSDAIANVEPRIDGYGPLPRLATFGTALPARCRGAFNYRRDNGASDIFAGTLTKLYKFDTATAAWVDVTRSSGGDYTMSDGDFWSFAQFGTRLVACNGVDATQYLDVDAGGTNFAALPNAPIGKYVQAIGDFLMIGDLSTDITAIAWSGINDSTYWTPGFRGSDTQSLPDGGRIMGLVPYSTGAVVFQRDKIRILERVGGNLVFAIRVLHDQIGCFSPQSIVSVRNEFFWYDQGGFYQGIAATPIGAEKVNRYVKETASGTYLNRLRGANDPTKQIVWWIVDTSTNTTEMIGYDWLLGRWTRSTQSVDFHFPAITPGYTIDSIDSIFGTMDEITIPFDSTFWQGTGVLAMAGFTYAGTWGYFQGFNQAAILETNDFEISPGNHGFLQSLRVISDAPYSSVTAQAGTRPFHGQSVTWGSAVTPSSSTGRAFLRKRGKLHRVRVNFADEAMWNYANGVTVYARGAGSR
jgi:hypothetical protein